MPRRLPSLLLLVVTVGCLQVGVAAGLTTTAAGLGAGSSAVAACDGDGFTFQAVVDTSGRITTVTTSGIHGACAGGTLRVTLVNGTASVGAGSVALPSVAFSGSADVSISPQPLSSGVTAVHAAIEGP